MKENDLILIAIFIGISIIINAWVIEIHEKRIKEHITQTCEEKNDSKNN